MKHDCFISVPFTDTLKIWAHSLILAFTILLKKVIYRLFKSPVPVVHTDKPIPCLVENSWGNHMYVKANGVKFHYVQLGDRKHPLVILLHGFPDCWLGWRQQMNVLSKHFRVIALDLKGFGDSEKPQWRSQYSLTLILRELREFVRNQGVKRCIVIGHDLGAIIGWYFAAQHPVLVSKFVSISGAHPNIHWGSLQQNKKFNTSFLNLCQMPNIPENEIRKDDYAFIKEFYSFLERLGESNLIDAYKYVFSRPEDVTGPLHYLRTLPLLRLREAKLRVPTLLLMGTNDPYIPVEAFVRSASFLVNYEMKLIDQAGHFPHQQRSTEVNELILLFLLGPKIEKSQPKVEVSRGLLGSLMSSTFKYGNNIVDNVVKTKNVVWRPTNAKFAE